MSNLQHIEKRYLEGALQMGDGYVLDYSDKTFGEFFERHGVNIHGPQYRTYGSSKAKKLRSFWDQEPDALVGQVLSNMLDEYEAECEIIGKDVNGPLLKKTRGILMRLLEGVQEANRVNATRSFLSQEFAIPSIQNLPVEPAVASIIESRLHEVRTALKAGAYLSVVVLCGSILEGVLLGSAQKDPATFNKSSASPKAKDGRVKRFHDWTLSEFIAVASDIGVLKPDVQKFSFGLRDFRNYIHPYQQLSSKFTPDEHTARVCFQVLKAALASVARQRS